MATMTIRTNADRSESAHRALELFSDITSLDGEEVDTKISDLLCNLQHLADENGVDFSECLERAYRQYENEVVQ